jgi:hypothetical protein
MTCRHHRTRPYRYSHIRASGKAKPVPEISPYSDVKRLKGQKHDFGLYVVVVL